MASDTFVQHHTILPRMAQLKGSGEGEKWFVFPAPLTELSHVLSEHTTCYYWEVTSLIVFEKTHSHTLRLDASSGWLEGMQRTGTA